MNTDVSDLAKKVLSLAKDSIIVKYRFFDKALAAIELTEDETATGYVGSAGKLTYSPIRLLKDYMEDENFAVRLLLHVIFHNIFLHYSRKDIADRQYWDMACDIAVENAVLALESDHPRLRDTDVQITLAKLNKWISRLTAENVYREFMVGGISTDFSKEFAALLPMDIHFDTVSSKQTDEIVISRKDWEKIARQVAAELRSFSKDIKGVDTVLYNLKQSMRKVYDYDDIVRRFAVMNEEIRVNPDEFDYIYYTYGLSLYENMPLIEPLEYTDEKRIKEFVIAVDTSASVRGKAVESFLTRTYDLLAGSVMFSETLNVHIIQCDSAVTSDITVTSRNELGQIAGNMQVRGFGATDFRPVFEYVRDMIARREFTGLKGLIYFTDGYGIYPDNPPGYDCMFVFENEDDYRPPVPGWAIKVCLT